MALVFAVLLPIVFSQILDVNIKAAALLVKEAHPHLRKNG